MFGQHPLRQLPDTAHEAGCEERQDGSDIAVTARRGEDRDEAQGCSQIAYQPPTQFARGPIADEDSRQHQHADNINPEAVLGLIAVDIQIRENRIGNGVEHQHLQRLEEALHYLRNRQRTGIRLPRVTEHDGVQIAVAVQAHDFVTQHVRHAACDKTDHRGTQADPATLTQQQQPYSGYQRQALRADMIIEHQHHNHRPEPRLLHILPPRAVLTLRREVFGQGEEHKRRGEEERSLAHHHRGEMP